MIMKERLKHTAVNALTHTYSIEVKKISPWHVVSLCFALCLHHCHGFFFFLEIHVLLFIYLFIYL